jgi:hypothetical protein
MVKATGDTDHVLHFCADCRSVRSVSVAKSIANIETPLYTDGQPFAYAGYVSGKYLDDRAINERTQFAISDAEDAGLFSDQELVWPELIGETAIQSQAFLEQFTAPVKAKKMERIRKFVMEEASQYRPLLKHKLDKLDRISAQIPDDKLDIELYKIDQEYDAELRERCATLLAQGDPKALELAQHRVEMERFTEEWNEHGMGKLARHVAYRKATLRFLYSRLHQQTSGKYSLEESMHEVVFPLRTTSDDVRADQMNLWILDEKLAYHFYLASETRFDQMHPAADVDSADRPDIIIFDKPFAFSDAEDPYRSVSIVEFKRPERDNYPPEASKKNPISQVGLYAERLRDGTALDRHGNTMNIGKNVPVYAYIVCDLTPTLRENAKLSQLTETPDNDGYFGFHGGYKVYMEILSYKKLLGDAKRRNERFFDELGVGRSCTT